MIDIVAVDIGGTNARFALARIEGGRVARLDPPVTLKTSDYPSFESAWDAFVAHLDHPAPRFAGIAVASPVAGDAITLTNNAWILRPASLDARLGLDGHVLINDFGAIGHAVAHLGPDDLRSLCGPDAPLPREGVISIIGPGTGLGVAQILRVEGRSHVIETEGGHIGFAPSDPVEDAILGHLRHRFGRVSVERLCCGPGLAHICEALAAYEGRRIGPVTAEWAWTQARAGSDPLALAALDRFCMILGTVAGDIALAHGAHAVVVAGGLGQRIADYLPNSAFAARFAAKGRFAAAMERLPVKIITRAEPGLIGAAAAFAEESRR